MAIVAGKSTEQLIEENQGLVYHLAMRVHSTLPVRHDLDDLIGYGMVGLAEAAKHFKPARGNQFSTFAFHRIRGSIYDGLAKGSWMSRARYRRYTRQKRVAEQNQVEETAVDADEDWQPTEATVQELTPEHLEQLSEEEHTAETNIDRTETADILCQLVDKLPLREQRLIRLVYFEGMSLEEAGDRIGVSKSWASRLHAKTIEQMGMDIRKAHAELCD